MRRRGRRAVRLWSPAGIGDVYELGDVVIAPDVAERQTHEFGTTLEQEISLLFVHGLLHLCGYDHIVEEDAKVMEALEDEVFSCLERAIMGMTSPDNKSFVRSAETKGEGQRYKLHFRVRQCWARSCRSGSQRT